jgi:hypothetical protein
VRIVPRLSLLMRYITREYNISLAVNAISIVFWLNVTLFRCCPNALGAGRHQSVGLIHVHNDQKDCRRHFYGMQRLRGRDQHEQDL